MSQLGASCMPGTRHMEWSYKNQRVLAPMVRVSTLPMRLLCKKVCCGEILFVTFFLNIFFVSTKQNENANQQVIL